MENITQTELISQIETGLVDQYLGTFGVGGDVRAFYRSYKGAANEPTGYKIVYIVVSA